MARLVAQLVSHTVLGCSNIEQSQIRRRQVQPQSEKAAAEETPQTFLFEVRSVVAVPTRSLKAVTDAKVTCTESLRQAICHIHLYPSSVTPCFGSLGRRS